MKINQENFRNIYDTYFTPICKFLNYYSKDEQLIQEVVQDVFVKLWEEKDNLDIEYIKTYLYNASRNRIFNEIRDHNNRISLLENWAKREFESQEAEDCVDMEEFVKLLQMSVETLPPNCKEIYVMSRELNLSYKDIAQQKGISVKTVEAQMGIALKRIREKMIKYYSDQGGTNLIILLLMELWIENIFSI